jgi:hypothetical protein
LEISRIIWLEDIVEKLLWKHNVEEPEVIEVFENRPVFQRRKQVLDLEKMSMRLLGEPTQAVF